MNCDVSQGTLNFVSGKVLGHNELHDFYTKCKDFSNSQYETDVSTVRYRFLSQMPLDAFHSSDVFKFGAAF